MPAPSYNKLDVAPFEIDFEQIHNPQELREH